MRDPRMSGRNRPEAGRPDRFSHANKRLGAQGRCRRRGVPCSPCSGGRPDRRAAGDARCGLHDIRPACGFGIYAESQQRARRLCLGSGRIPAAANSPGMPDRAGPVENERAWRCARHCGRPSNIAAALREYVFVCDPDYRDGCGVSAKRRRICRPAGRAISQSGFPCPLQWAAGDLQTSADRAPQ